MPQASDHLRAEFPGYDSEAMDVIGAHFEVNRGLISPKQPGYTPTERESDAIDYLVFEWDYAYGDPEQ
jgi:hypothetical protein